MLDVFRHTKRLTPQFRIESDILLKYVSKRFVRMQTAILSIRARGKREEIELRPGRSIAIV